MKDYYNMQNLNKYKAYKNIADNYEQALDLVRDKRPVLGEPVVVPYYSPDVDDPDKRINLLFAVGSLNGEFAVISGRGKDSSSADYAQDASTAFYAQHASATGLLGIIPLENLPQGAIETLVKVTDASAMLDLTIADVQNGDSVLTIDNNQMYIVTDEDKLGTMDAFTEYSSGTATHALQADWAASADTAENVDWTGVLNKPTTFDASTITKLTGYQEADLSSDVTPNDSLLVALGKIEKKANDAAEQPITNIEIENIINNSNLTDF